MNKIDIDSAKETMRHWIDYEKENKDKINKADELIAIQETLLNYIEQMESGNPHPRYFNFITVKLFDIEVSIKLGNPLWFVYEFRKEVNR